MVLCDLLCDVCGMCLSRVSKVMVENASLGLYLECTGAS